MKKALVLGVLAIFAFNIANVNAQDRTNVQQKPKKTYEQVPATKGENKAINQTTKKTTDPASKQVNPAKPSTVKTTRASQAASDKKKATDKFATETEATQGVKKVDPKNASVIDDNQKAQKKAAEAKAEKMAAEQDNTNVNANSAKKTTAPINNNVPPKPNTAKKTTAKGKTTSDK